MVAIELVLSCKSTNSNAKMNLKYKRAPIPQEWCPIPKNLILNGKCIISLLKSLLSNSFSDGDVTKAS